VFDLTKTVVLKYRNVGLFLRVNASRAWLKCLSEVLASPKQKVELPCQSSFVQDITATNSSFQTDLSQTAAAFYLTRARHLPTESVDDATTKRVRFCLSAYQCLQDGPREQTRLVCMSPLLSSESSQVSLRKPVRASWKFFQISLAFTQP